MSEVPSQRQPGYRRSAGSARGRARREELLERVTEDLAAHGLADFSLRRAARAAGTTHKVLLYHFDGPEELLGQALLRLRGRRIEATLAAAAAAPSLAGRVRAIWSALEDDATGLRVIDQSIGLAMYDPRRYAHLAQDASDQYRGPLRDLCPPHWPDQRRAEVAEMILAMLRGLLMEWQTTRDRTAATAALAAFTRALDAEEGRS